MLFLQPVAGLKQLRWGTAPCPSQVIRTQGHWRQPSTLHPSEKWAMPSWEEHAVFMCVIYSSLTSTFLPSLGSSSVRSPETPHSFSQWQKRSSAHTKPVLFGGWLCPRSLKTIKPGVGAGSGLWRALCFCEPRGMRHYPGTGQPRHPWRDRTSELGQPLRFWTHWASL